jgi:uncharacterized protein VirK/YbjX
MKAEYKTLANATGELMWVHRLLKELRVHSPFATGIWCDNVWATYLTANLTFHRRTKHVKVDFHFVQERVANKLLNIMLISTNDQVTYGFTKLIMVKKLESFRINLEVGKL